MTTRARNGSIELMDCRELLYGRRFPLRLKGAVYQSYVKPPIVYDSEA